MEIPSNHAAYEYRNPAIVDIILIMKLETPPIRTKPKILRLHPSAFLLVAQLLQLVLFAVVESLHSERALISAFSVVILVLIVWVVNHSPGPNWLAWILAVPAFALSLLSAAFVDPTLLIWSALLNAILYFFAAGSLIAYMMQDERVTTDELFAVGATFTLLAWGFAYLYLVCQTLIPGSFISGLVLDRPLNFIEFLSLSFTNLSATGLGDIMPQSAWARILVMLEQMIGIGYVAIVVSRLIGMTLQKQSGRHR